MSEKKKFNATYYNEITRFISDHPFEKAIRIIDASEKDMAHFISKVIEQDENEAIIDIGFTNMSLLTIHLKSWAHGSQTQVLILRRKSQKLQAYKPPLNEIQYEKEPVSGQFALLVLIAIVSFSVTLTTGNWLFSLPIPLLLFLAIQIETNRIKSKESKSSSSQSPKIVKKASNNPYEDSLVKYIQNRLNADENSNMDIDSIQDKQKGTLWRK